MCRRLLDRVLPAGVSAVETRVDEEDAGYLEEQQIVADAAPGRRREFLAGRWCAHRALSGIGITATSVGMGPFGEPCWPEGVVGSIAHCAGYRAAAVARRLDFYTLGLDVEPVGPLPEGVLDWISTPDERSALRLLPSGVPWERLLFSAKESACKAWFPLTRRRMGLRDFSISVGVEGGFTARLPPADRAVGDPRSFAGSWEMDAGLLVTAVAVRHPPRGC